MYSLAKFKFTVAAVPLCFFLGFGGMHLTHHVYHQLRANLVYPHPGRDAEVRKTDRLGKPWVNRSAVMVMSVR